ncbi:MAG: HAMP domain-containing sensor histidine kinase, partial [Candidatus Hydrogenedentota bacterium]
MYNINVQKDNKTYKKTGIIVFLIVVYILVNIGGWIFYLSLSDAFDLSINDSLRSILLTLRLNFQNVEVEVLKNRLNDFFKEGIVQSIVLVDKDFNVLYDSEKRFETGKKYPLSPLIEHGIKSNYIYITEAYEKDEEIYKIGVVEIADNYLIIITPTFVKDKMNKLKRILYVVAFISFIGLFILWFIMDILIKKIMTAQRELSASERLLALGRLSAGVAHEIRNPLGIISGTAEVLKKRQNIDEKDKVLLSYIEEETERIEKVVKNFLKFSEGRFETNSQETVDLNEELEKVIIKEEHLLKERNIEIDIKLDPNVEKVKFSQDEINSIIRNLIQNAIESFDNLKNKLIIIKTINRGDYIILSIEDSGVGIQDNI